MSIPPAESSTHTADAAMMREMLGPQFGQIRYAIMSTGSAGVFLELFESVNPPTELVSERATFWRTGPWHIAVTDPDIEGLVSSIEANGGRVLSAVHPLVDGASFQICMCVDPFGVTIEVYSHPLEEILAAMAG